MGVRRAAREWVTQHRTWTANGRRYLDWNLPDPADASAAEVRDIRDDIAERVQSLLSRQTRTLPTAAV